MKKQNILLLILFGFLFSSCRDFKELSFSGIENMKIVNMSQQGLELEITATIKNPNKTAFHIYPSVMDATINGINAGQAHLTNSVKLKPNSEKPYTFHLKSNFSNLNLTDLPKLMSVATSKSAKIGLKGDLKVGKFLVKKKYPVDFSKRVPLSLN